MKSTKLCREQNTAPAGGDIKSMSRRELSDLFDELDQPPFRSGQMFNWLHAKRAERFEEMTDLPAALRQELESRCYITALTAVTKLVSKLDGTVKYLYELPDGNCIETVLMKYKHGNSLCISTQVGCRMGCKFCASTLGGLVRNLTPSEMLEQVYQTVRDSGQRVDSVVLMGIGEPLDNLENVLRFLELLSDPLGYSLGLRHISLSTCGLVPEIRQLMGKKLQLTLSISLHGVDNQTRGAVMPINARYPIEELMAVCREYFKATGRRISFEYALMEGVNDQPEHAKKLSELMVGMPCHVNLIPVNPVRERGYRRTSKGNVQRFAKLLKGYGVNATVRRELGGDINAACGQLRRQAQEGENQ